MNRQTSTRGLQSHGTRHRLIARIALTLVVFLVAVGATLFAVERAAQLGGPSTRSATPPPAPSAVHEQQSTRVSALAFGAQDMAVQSITMPASPSSTPLLYFDVEIEPMAVPTSRAALVSFRVHCRSAGEPVEMQASGKVSTNIFLARGGQVSGQALGPQSPESLTCTLVASAPFIEAVDDRGPTGFVVRAELREAESDGEHVLALHRLEDATLIEPGSNETVLSRRIDDPTSLDRMSSTVRLTSCTVVGGSRDAGENMCLESMAGRESATVRIRVVARWLDASGNIAGTSTYWDETLAVDYNTHHVPWTLRQRNLQDRVPDDVAGVVLVVQVESVGGTPVVVHADGTDAVITTTT